MQAQTPAPHPCSGGAAAASRYVRSSAPAATPPALVTLQHFQHPSFRSIRTCSTPAAHQQTPAALHHQQHQQHATAAALTRRQPPRTSSCSFEEPVGSWLRAEGPRARPSSRHGRCGESSPRRGAQGLAQRPAIRLLSAPGHGAGRVRQQQSQQLRACGRAVPAPPALAASPVACPVLLLACRPFPAAAAQSEAAAIATAPDSPAAPHAEAST